MSVIVKGMEMPDNCEECQLMADGWCYGVKNQPGTIYFHARPDWCPLRPLPEKHGRLGDLDELESSFRESIGECKKWIKEAEEGGDTEIILIARQSFNTFVESRLRTKSMKTIVEAEGD